MAHWLARLLKHRLFDEAMRAACSARTRWRASRRASPRARSATAARSASSSRPGCRSATCAASATPRDRAVALFGKLGVWDTERNNGVLIYLLLAERAIEIVADRGLNRLVPAAEWDEIAASMQSAFQAGDFEGGLLRAVDAVDALLVRHFAARPGDVDVNELPDAPLFR